MPIQQRRITAREYEQLAVIGVLGEGGVELLDGWIVYGKYPFAFTEEAVQAARAAGIELTEREENPGAAAVPVRSLALATSLHGHSPRAERGRTWSRSC